MSLDALRRLVRGELSEDIERLRSNMATLIEHTRKLEEIDRKLEEIVKLLREIKGLLKD